jgi:hypothetical protein
MKSLFALCVLSFAIGCASDASAQNPARPSNKAPADLGDAPPAPTSPAPARAVVSIDEVLDALDRQGDQIKDFTADVALTETDELTKEAFTRAGTVRFQKLPDGDARIRVDFKTRKAGDGKPRPEQIEYLLDKGWLTERNYRKTNQVRRQVIKPGEKIDLLKLGEGPFPLPIGQAKEDVKRMFDVEVVPTAEGDPAGTIRGRLKPKEGTQFARRFKHIDVWVDPRAQMPRRIETLDVNEQTRQTTDLENVKANTGLRDDDFKLKEVNAKDGWTFVDEPYQE